MYLSRVGESVTQWLRRLPDNQEGVGWSPNQGIEIYHRIRRISYERNHFRDHMIAELEDKQIFTYFEGK